MVDGGVANSLLHCSGTNHPPSQRPENHAQVTPPLLDQKDSTPTAPLQLSECLDCRKQESCPGYVAHELSGFMPP
jgi:hypothetical protein